MYDGSTWIIPSAHHATINLSDETISLLEWARKKRNEEIEMEKLAQTNSTIKDLVTQIKEKKNKFILFKH